MVGLRIPGPFTWVCVLFAISATFAANQCDFRVLLTSTTEGGCFAIEGSPTDTDEVQDDYKSWADAEADCQAKGGYLARFSTPEWEAFEAYETAAGLTESHHFFRFWTGGSRDTGSDNWQYGDGENVDFISALGTGFVEESALGNCLMALPNRPTPLRAQDCTQNRPYVCEYELCDFQVGDSCFAIEGSPTDAEEIQDDYKSWADAEADC